MRDHSRQHPAPRANAGDDAIVAAAIESGAEAIHAGDLDAAYDALMEAEVIAETADQLRLVRSLRIQLLEAVLPRRA
ncbi:MAG TPA: hypothetical protein VEL07_10860 [Planctomycetota bacterium]|nr:hypothetical protein [Planctomycetota bacterium]